MAAFFLSPSSLSLLPNSLSSLSSLSLSLSPLSTHRRLRLPLPLPSPPPPLTIRGGGGPRTFPGGVSQLQWKRMQAKKSKQLLKARILRERQLYEARKRSELKAALAHLEKPWEELAERRTAAPTPFSAAADDQVRALADRFHRPGGFDTWSDSDGPRVFRRIAGGELPTARFFPKGAVHSVRPYGVGEPEVFDDWIARGGSRRKRRARRPRSGTQEEEEGVRPNACVEGNGRSGSARNDDGITLRPAADVVDLEAVDRTEGVRWNSSERADGKAAGGERYGMINWWHRGKNSDSDSDSDSDSATLRPTTDLVDLEVVGRKESVRWNSSERADGKARYGMINPWHRGKKNDSGRSGSMRNDGITLRPTADIVDVEAVDGTEGVRWNSSERADGKAAGGERYGMINRWHSGKKNVSDSARLRPTTDIVDLKVVGCKEEGLGWRWNSSWRADAKPAGGGRYGVVNWWHREVVVPYEEV